VDTTKTTTENGPQPGGPSVTTSGVARPARLIAIAYVGAVAIGTALLKIPAATAPGKRTDLLDALFTAASAVSITGLAVVDTGSHWSLFGQIVILGLMQVGGLGIMTLATLVTVLVFGRLDLRTRLLAQAETRAVSLHNIRLLLRNIAVFIFISEGIASLILGMWLTFYYHEPPARAFYYGVFHAISAFNNGGLALYPDSLARYVGDPVVCLTISAAVIVGGLGYPVVFELGRKGGWRPKNWSVLTRITVIVSTALLVLGTIAITLAELTNPATLGPLSPGQKVLAGFFHTTMTRSGGLNTVDVSQMRPSTWFFSDVLMFIGGGSASTSGGIKVTTFGLLAFVLWSEVRGEPTVLVGKRRIPADNQRQALTVALISIGVVVLTTLVLLAITPYGLDRVLFETVSAFATVGLSTGITTELNQAATVILSILMIVGRVGPLTVATALALRQRTRRYDRPEERTIIG
jgi:potassium uptake TrkH family protein